jgi:hypothetical protein
MRLHVFVRGVGERQVTAGWMPEPGATGRQGMAPDDEGSTTEHAVQTLQDAGKAVAGAAGGVAVDRVRAEVDARSSRVSVEVKAFAVSMRASSASLREQGHDGQADLVDEVAVRADRLAARLATADTDDLVADAKHLMQEGAAFARREPALVIAGAFTLGLLVPKVVDAVASGALRVDATREEST